MKKKPRVVKEGWMAVHPLRGPEKPRVEVVPAAYCEQVESDLRRARAEIRRLKKIIASAVKEIENK